MLKSPSNICTYFISFYKVSELIEILTREEKSYLALIDISINQSQRAASLFIHCPENVHVRRASKHLSNQFDDFAPL